MWVHLIICDWRNIGLFWTIFENMRRDKAKFFKIVLECLWDLEELWETTEYFIFKKRQI
jgi:hypothetical protein